MPIAHKGMQTCYLLLVFAVSTLSHARVGQVGRHIGNVTLVDNFHPAELLEVRSGQLLIDVLLPRLPSQ